VYRGWLFAAFEIAEETFLRKERHYEQVHAWERAGADVVRGKIVIYHDCGGLP
jgi:hypothetical protein